MLYALEDLRKRRLQSFGDSFNIHNRNITHSPLNSAVVGPVKTAAVRSLLLIDPLFFANPSDRTAKTDSYIERH